MKTPDVVIVGGGIIGGAIAFELAQQKLRATLLDRQQPGLEASWAAAGMLAPVPESSEPPFMLAFERKSFALYPSFVAAVEEASGENVSYRSTQTIQTFFDEGAESTASTMAALCAGAGIAAETLTLEKAVALEPNLNPEARAAVLLPAEATVDPRALTRATLAAAAARGAEIRAGAAVTGIVIEHSRCVGVNLAGEKVSAGKVIVAAGSYSGQIETVKRYAPTVPVRGQMVALRSERVALACVLRSEHGYMVPRPDGRIIAGSTLENAGFDKRVTPAGIQQVVTAALELVPALADAAVVESWAGLRPGSPDHLPILGPTDIEGLWIATGHYRNGILLAPVTSRVMCEWILRGKTSVDVTAFSPLRFLASPAGATA